MLLLTFIEQLRDNAVVAKALQEFGSESPKADSLALRMGARKSCVCNQRNALTKDETTVQSCKPQKKKSASLVQTAEVLVLL